MGNAIQFFPKEEYAKTPVFEDVDEDQFFVNSEGQLCQKVDNDTYNIVADSDGEPFANHIKNVDTDEEIKRICPSVNKIEF